MEGDDGDDNDRQVQKTVKAECHQRLPEALRKVLMEFEAWVGQNRMLRYIKKKFYKIEAGGIHVWRTD